MKNGTYIYGIIKTSSPQEFGAIGIGNSTASATRTIGYKDLAAVVSNSPLVSYDSLDKERVVKDLVTHQFVIERVMEHFTIIPVKFGTMVETDDEAVQFLEKGYTLLNNELSRMAGKIELDVVAWWELPKILATISGHNSRLREMRQEIEQKGKNVSVEDKVMLGRSVEQALKAEKARYQQLILQTLQQAAIDDCQHELANDEMILNAAFLLEKRDEEPFHTTITALDQKLEDTINFRVVGPLPLYSFSTVLLERFDPSSVEAARSILGLSGEMTHQTIRDAYWQLAKKFHPDKNDGKETTEFQHIKSAQKTLQKFIEHGPIYVEIYRWKQEL